MDAQLQKAMDDQMKRMSDMLDNMMKNMSAAQIQNTGSGPAGFADQQLLHKFDNVVQ